MILSRKCRRHLYRITRRRMVALFALLAYTVCVNNPLWCPGMATNTAITLGIIDLPYTESELPVVRVRPSCVLVPYGSLYSSPGTSLSVSSPTPCSGRRCSRYFLSSMAPTELPIGYIPHVGYIWIIDPHFIILISQGQIA